MLTHSLDCLQIQTGNSIITAAEIAAELADGLWADRGSLDGWIKARFSFLRLLVETLPLDLPPETLGFIRNWIHSAQQLWLSGEKGAAHYQVRQVSLRLSRLSAEAEPLPHHKEPKSGGQRPS